MPPRLFYRCPPTSGPTAAASQAPAKPYLNTTPFYGHGDLAFVSLGDLYVLDGASRHVVNVTGADLAASDPEFSPNGKWLTYETDQGETSWLARADGLGSKRLAGTASWLPNGQLALGGPTSTSTFTVGNNEALLPTGGSAEASAVRAGSSVIYLFVTNTLQVHPPRSSQGVERVETAASPNGRRTLWYEAPVSFSPAGGLEGTFVGNVSVLPDRRALLLTISHYCCDYADGQDFYELRSPLGQPRLLGTVLNASAVPTVGPSGTFAFGGGGDRYAWVSKHVEQCVRGHRHLHQGANPGKRALCLTGLVPQRADARFCRSERREEGAIGQPQVLSWYATHHLYLLAAGSDRPVEVAHTQGAAAPLWSEDSQSLLFVDDDALYLIAQPGSAPVEVAGPLFSPGSWSGYFGEIAWTTQFGWSQS